MAKQLLDYEVAQRVLAALGIKRSPLSLVKMYFAALFVSNFLPSTIGGDVARASWLSLQIPGDGDAVASVVLERFSGFSAPSRMPVHRGGSKQD